VAFICSCTGQLLLNDDEVKEAVKTWLSSQVAMFYEEGIQKLVPRYDKSEI
jgi:hypothetical protein